MCLRGRSHDPRGLDHDDGDDGDTDEDEEEPDHGGKRPKLKHVLKKLFGGCSTTGPTTSEGGLGWLALGLSALVLRRRTRKVS